MPLMLHNAAAFPTEKVKRLLSFYWDSKMQSPLKAPVIPTSRNIFALQPSLSSQQAVGVLVSLKAILGYRPSKNVIQKGGYPNKAEFLANTIGQLEKEWLKKQSSAVILAQTSGAETNAAIAV